MKVSRRHKDIIKLHIYNYMIYVLELSFLIPLISYPSPRPLLFWFKNRHIWSYLTNIEVFEMGYGQDWSTKTAVDSTYFDVFWFKFWCILWIFGQVAFVIFAEFASCLAMAIFMDSLASQSLDQRTAALSNVLVFQNLGTALGSAIYALTLLPFQAETD